MRPPARSVYRSFRELDGLTDEDCTEFVRQARLQARKRWRVGEFAALYALLVASMVVMRPLGSVLLDAIPLRREYDVFAFLVVTVCLAVFVTPWSLAVWWWSRRVDRRAIRVRLAEARCSRCRYTLEGLPREVGKAVCPECGSREVVGAAP